MKSLMVDDSLESEVEMYTGAVIGEDTAYSVTSPPLFEYGRVKNPNV